MGRFGSHVIDADGHGGEAADWPRLLPAPMQERYAQWRKRCAEHFGRLPLPGEGLARKGDPFEQRAGMLDPQARLADMDLEGIDVTVTFPGGAGEEWALLDREFAIALCRALNDAKAAFCARAPGRVFAVAKLPMIDPAAAAEELRRAVTRLGLRGMVTPQHIRERNLDDPAFDVVWSEAQRLGVPVCVHGGGQAPDQCPVAIDRFRTRLEVHALTHPLGNMIALDCFTVGGILARFPSLRVAFLESGCGWLPFWLERLDEHYELMPEQAPHIDRKPSEYFLDGNAWVACEPGEQGLGYVAQRCGAGKLLYASDYYHWDCGFPDTVRTLAGRADLSDVAKRQILSSNAARLYGF
jgi:predicted TIM-barrel fold metal-dependent hydrolase